MGPLGQSDLLRRTALTAHAAVVHAAGLRAAEALVEEDDGEAHASQGKSRGASDEPAADDGDIPVKGVAHAVSSSAKTPNGMGLMGG